MKNVRQLPKSEYEAARRSAARPDPVTAKLEPRAPSAVFQMTDDEYDVAKRAVAKPTKT